MRTGKAAVDGRHARHLQNKARVVQAVLDLIRETGAVPTVDAAAERAGVSRRSVFRFFTDRESLMRAATEARQHEMAAMFPPPEPPAASLAGGVQAVVDHRAAVYEYISPARQLAERLKCTDPIIRSEHERLRRSRRACLAEYFREYLPPPGPQWERALDGLQLALSWNAWWVLRHDFGRTTDEAKEAVALAVRGILAADTPAPR